MSSFFTNAGLHKKRKRSVASDAPKKKLATARTATKPVGKATSSARKQAQRDQATSGSDEDDEDENVSSASSESEAEGNISHSDEEGETAAEKRLRLAERYLENVKEHIDEVGFDAADIDRDLIAERLQEDLAETKGRVYRQLASDLDFSAASRSSFRSNTGAVTAAAACAPYVYTVTKDLYLHKWRIQELPQYQYSKRTKRKPKKPPAPPRRRPILELWVKGSSSKSRDKNYKRHVGRILAVAASPDGRYVVTGGQDRKLIVYEAATLKPVKVFTHHRDAVTGLAFRRGTNQLFSASKDRTVKFWSLDELAYVETLFGHQDEVVDIDALAQERCVSVGARDRTARLWKVIEETQLVFRGGAVGKQLRTDVDPRSLLHEGSMDRVAMIDDDLFVTGSDNGAITLWSLQKKKPVYIEPIAHGIDPPLEPMQASAEEEPSPGVVPAPTPRWITALKTIPYSDVILSGSWDGCVRIWKLSDDKRKIEALAALGEPQQKEGARATESDSTTRDTLPQPARAIPGIINDIAVFERGDRGKDGLCIVATTANEHRLGRWKVCKGVRNGGVVFEVPKLPSLQANGTHNEYKLRVTAS